MTEHEHEMEPNTDTISKDTISKNLLHREPKEGSLQLFCPRPACLLLYEYL